jgi:hypothetical protein
VKSFSRVLTGSQNQTLAIFSKGKALCKNFPHWAITTGPHILDVQNRFPASCLERIAIGGKSRTVLTSNEATWSTRSSVMLGSPTQPPSIISKKRNGT